MTTKTLFLYFEKKLLVSLHELSCLLYSCRPNMTAQPHPHPFCAAAAAAAAIRAVLA